MTTSFDEKADLEKTTAPAELQPSPSASAADFALKEEVGAASGPFGRFTRWLDAQGVEARGLDRVPEEERAPVSSERGQRAGVER